MFMKSEKGSLFVEGLFAVFVLSFLFSTLLPLQIIWKEKVALKQEEAYEAKYQYEIARLQMERAKRDDSDE